MAKLACYTCSTCGAVLNVEQGHKLFDCPFCGADFDYYFFYRKDLLEQADACLRRMDFEEAKERFEDILAHEPKEFLALRGLVLCAGHIISPKNLTSPEKLEGCKFDEVRSVLTEVTDIAAEEDKAYFHKLLILCQCIHSVRHRKLCRKRWIYKSAMCIRSFIVKLINRTHNVITYITMFVNRH